MAGRYGFNDEVIALVFLSAFLHDNGKIGLSDAILKKAATLTGAEFEAIEAENLMRCG